MTFFLNLFCAFCVLCGEKLLGSGGSAGRHCKGKACLAPKHHPHKYEKGLPKGRLYKNENRAIHEPPLQYATNVML